MTKAQVEVITSGQRRRYWSRAEKERIVAVAMEPSAVASEVAVSWDPYQPIVPLASAVVRADADPGGVQSGDGCAGGRSNIIAITGADWIGLA